MSILRSDHHFICYIVGLVMDKYVLFIVLLIGIIACKTYKIYISSNKIKSLLFLIEST